MKNNLVKASGLLIAISLLLTFDAHSQSGPPAPPPDPTLSAYSFQGSPWTSWDGDLPINYTNLVSFPLWNRNALLLDTTNEVPAFLNYPITENSDWTNISFCVGTLRTAFICDWGTADTNQNGTGPGDWAFLIGAGDFLTGSPDGLWAVYIDPGGTNIYFGGVSNSVSTVFVSAPISWPANSIHLIGISYTSSNSTMYLDGQYAASGGPVTIVPATNVWTNGFFVGSDAAGYEQAQGLFLSMEFYDSNFFDPDWSDIFGDSYLTNGWLNLSNNFTTWLAAQGGGFSFDSSDGFSLPPDPTNTVNTNYAAYTNFWLTVSNVSTNVNIRVVNTLSNVTYQILTNRNLASTNWNIWRTFLASNSITPMPAISLSSNAMFFQGRLVWSTGTNGLPDWWQMLYFNQLGVNPNGNPAGDGIDNLNKYLMGLNPNIAYVSPLIVLPPSGDYVSTPSISIYSLDGATIKYTTNGSTPSSTNGISISPGVPLTNLPSQNFTLKAWESGLTPNFISSNTYTIITAAPTFSIPSGVYSNGTTLHISCATTSATVRYTTNGADPTTNSTQIQSTNIITLTTNQTIKATAWFNGLVSPVATASYIIQYPPSNDNFSNAITLSGASGIVQGTLLDSTLEYFEITNADYACVVGSVWYKWTAPSNGSVYFNFPSYGEIFHFPSTTNSNPSSLVSVTWNGDDSFTATSNVTYYISVFDESWEPAPFSMRWFYTNMMAPVFIPPPGSYYAGQPVILSAIDPSSLIYYTLDGSSPLNGSQIATNAIYGGNSGCSVTLNQTTTINAISYYAAVSTITTGLYTISGNTNPTVTASAPVFSPANTNFASSLTLTLTCTNTNSFVFYTLDGSVPTRASASVPSGGMVTLTNSTDFNAIAWATNMNVSAVTTGWYTKDGVDTTGDGIPDSGALLIGADPFVSDANAVNSNPFAHGLDNIQVYQNQSVLLANNYSTENDGIPDWWLVKYGYSVTTPASALGANGQTLTSDYAAGINPNAPASNLQSGMLPPIDFHMVHGPSNSMVAVVDTVRPDIASYLLTCWNTDQGLPEVVAEFAANQSLDQPGGRLGRYFRVTNTLPPGYWNFTLQGINSNSLISQIASNSVTSDSKYNGWVPYLIGPAEYDSWTSYSGLPVPIVGYTNKNDLKEPLLAQMLRQESDVSVNGIVFEGAPDGWSENPVVYNDLIPSPVTTEASWGTLTFTNYYGYYAIDFASYFTAYCSTPDSPYDCTDYYSNWWGGLPGYSLTPLEVDFDNYGNEYFAMPTNIFNPAGLAYLSLTYQIGGNAPITLYPGQSNIVPTNGFVFEAALDTETPTFQPTNYYFDGRQYPLQDEDGDAQRSSPPDQSSDDMVDGWMGVGLFNGEVAPTSVTNPVIIAQVGRPVNLQSWSEVMAVRPNGDPITNQTYFIDQDFAQAYLCDPVTGDVPRTSQTNYNGQFKINTNTAVATGILSPSLDYTNVEFYNNYFGQRGADFTPTQPGKVIVTTMPDANGDYGELVIYVIDMQVDANHDGVMDNRDLTSVDNPMNFWVNNNYDRTNYDTADGVYYDDDVASNSAAAISPGTGVSTPDCNYLAANGTNCIPTQRDLEDYTRLWISGLSNMVANLPTNCGVNLQWRNNTGAAIRLFRAAETNGGTNYLFDSATAAAQTNYSVNPCYGYVSPSQTISLSQAFASTTVSIPSDYFIFCGASNGNDELILEVTNQYGGEVGEASVFLNLEDIKQMYERWTVGDNPTASPLTNAYIATNDLPASGAFQYPYNSSVDSEIPYILYVHGWNMETWEKDRWAETAYKRLYWQGFQGRFGIFRWPTDYDFTGDFDQILTNATEKDNFDSSENNAWLSGVGLLNTLNDLNTEYPGGVYVLAHSMGNIVTGEALRLASNNQVVNTYVATQAAVTAHTYDDTVSNYSFDASIGGIAVSFGPNTPNIYGDWFSGNNGSGAAQVISFYNTNDYALSRLHWQLDQLFKPDAAVSEGGSLWNYRYSGLFTDPPPWNNFFKTNTTGTTVNFNIVTNLANRYEVMSYAAQSFTTALGATPAVGNIIDVNLTLQGNGIWPSPDPLTNNYASHFWHSAEFRGDYWMQQGYWNYLLGSKAFHLK